MTDRGRYQQLLFDLKIEQILRLDVQLLADFVNSLQGDILLPVLDPLEIFIVSDFRHVFLRQVGRFTVRLDALAYHRHKFLNLFLGFHTELLS